MYDIVNTGLLHEETYIKPSFMTHRCPSLFPTLHLVDN